MSSEYLWSFAKYPLLGAAALGLLYRLPTSCLWCSEAVEGPLHADQMAKIRIIQELQENSGISFVGALRIPDTGGENHSDVDLVILTKRKLYLLEVKDWSNKVKSEADGSWCQKSEDGSIVRHGNVVAEVEKRAALLESYLVRRGLEISSGFVQLVIVFTNPDCRVDESILHIPGVFTLERWKAFLREKTQKNKLGWMKRQLTTGSIYQHLVCVLRTAPTWDRLTLEGGDILLGTFLHFDGLSDDLEALKAVKRSRVTSVRIKSKSEHLNVLGFQLTTGVSAEVSCTLRDYREIVSKRMNKENDEEPTWLAKVRGDTEVVFQVVKRTTSQSFKLSSLVSIQLSA